MKLQGEKLRKAIDEAGVTYEQLAEAVSRDGLRGERALRALHNWSAGRDHPRARRGDVDAIARVLGVLPKDLCRFTSFVMHNRGSEKKVKLITDMIRGKHVDAARDALRFSTQRAATNVAKALGAAIAEAEAADADETRLYVTESRVDKGMNIKRFQPKDRGRAHQILKRTSHITIGVEERR